MEYGVYRVGFGSTKKQRLESDFGGGEPGSGYKNPLRLERGGHNPFPTSLHHPGTSGLTATDEGARRVGPVTLWFDEPHNRRPGFDCRHSSVDEVRTSVDNKSHTPVFTSTTSTRPLVHTFYSCVPDWDRSTLLVQWSGRLVIESLFPSSVFPYCSAVLPPRTP